MGALQAKKETLPNAVVACEIAWHIGIRWRVRTLQTFSNEPSNWL
jgi:hypothetical protein